MVGIVTERVNGRGRGKRRYDARGRQESAAATRARILATAREAFTTKGYVATTIAKIADQAGVAPDTVYASVGAKPVLFRELIELALSGTDIPVPGAERDYVARMRAAGDAPTKLAIYAQAVTQIQERLAPLFLALRDAAGVDAQLADLWRDVTERRAANMRLLAADLASTGQLRVDLTLDQVADVIWSMNSAEYYTALVEGRAWTPAKFELWLRDAWQRLLLS